MNEPYLESEKLPVVPHMIFCIIFEILSFFFWDDNYISFSFPFLFPTPMYHSL